ncbi:WXG100-like domain-containing protein [Streptomyces cinereoruber]|uniref:WXG100-like domain-containing protein n=1 Tax=Streptomyces cinereoruber TaxID=67260 RepID=UPI003643F2AE
MAINPPEGIADFLAFVSGMEWPEADEDLMRRVAEHYGSIAEDLETLSGYVVELIPIVKNDFEGEAAASFLVAMRDLTGQTAGANQLEQTAELSRQLSEVALKVANQVEYTKIMAILQLVQLLAEILFATLFSAFTFGAVWGPVSALFAATREGLHQLFRWLLQTIVSQTFIGIIGGVFQDTVIQLHQLTSGHTKSWNTESLLDSVKQGALSGVVAGPLEILSHYGGKLLGRLLGGKPPASIISKRVDDILKETGDKLNDVAPNPKPDVTPGGATKPDGPTPKAKEDLPPTPPNTPPTAVTPPPVPPKTGVTPPPVPPKTVGDGLVPPPAAVRPKPEAPGGGTSKPGASAPGASGAGKGTTPPTGRTGAPATPPKADVPTTGKGDVPGTDKTDVPAPPRTETAGGDAGSGVGKAGSGDVPTAGTGAKVPDASGAASRTAGDVENPMDDLFPTPEARSAFAKDIGELFGGVARNLETGFMRHGEGSIAHSFSEKMGEVFSKHLGREGAEEAGKAFGEMLTQKWGRLGADHTELPGLLTKAMGDLGNLAPLKNLADSTPTLFARSEHGNVLARVFKQENPLQGNPMYQLGGAISSLLNEGTNEMLSEGFYNLIFGDGTFKVSGGPFASGVAMGALSAGLHRAFEPIMVKYQNWVLTHQHADNPTDSKYFGLLHPINIASFVSNMTGNPAPWPVPRPTSDQQETSFRQDMKDMVNWVFSHPITGTPFFTDLPQQPDAAGESDGGDASSSTNDGGGTSSSTGDAPAPPSDGTGSQEGDGGAEAAGTPSRATVSSDLSSLLGGDTDSPSPDLTEQNGSAPRPVTQSGGDSLFTVPTERENTTTERQTVAAEGTETQTGATPRRRPHPLQAEKDAAAAEGLDYLLPYDPDHDDDLVTDGPEVSEGTANAAGGENEDRRAGTGNAHDAGAGRLGDAGRDDENDDGRTDDGALPRPETSVRDIPSGIALGVLSPAQTGALRSIPKRPGVFVVGMHTDPNAPNDPDTVLKALTDAHDEGRLDDVTEIHFTACNLASPVHESTVKTVMSGLWKHRAGTGAETGPDPLTARAADAPVWYVPTTSGDAAGGHLLTAQHIGLTGDGRIAVVNRGAWHVYSDGGDPDHTPDRTTPDPDALPDDAVAFPFRTPEVDAEHRDAVEFGDDGRPPVDNGEGSSTGARRLPDDAQDRTPPREDPPAWAPDASIEDLVRIRYMQESERYERRLADHLFTLRPVQEMAEFLARAVVHSLRGTPLYDGLGHPSRSVPGSVGEDPSEWERVAESGNARERMTLFFQAIASTALPTLVNFPADYPSSLHEERTQRSGNPDAAEYATLDKFRGKQTAERWNSSELAGKRERWHALDSVMRPFRADEVTPPLSRTERERSVNDLGKMDWNPGGISLRIRMDQPYQQAAEKAGRLVRSGTSGSGFYFHRYAEMLARRVRFPIDHGVLRLAITAAFLSEGHHTLPEVMAASSLFAEEYPLDRDPRPDVRVLLQPVDGPSPAWNRYMSLPPLSPEHLRNEVARDGLFPHEHAENLRRVLLERRGPDPSHDTDDDADSDDTASYMSYGTDSDESYETDSNESDESDESDDDSHPTASGSAPHDTAGPGAWAAPLTLPVQDIPSGIAVGPLSPAQTAALHALPRRSGVFVVGAHTDPDAPHDPATLLKALTDAHDQGRLDGVTEIHFTVCDLASPVHESTIRTVMSGLWTHRAASGTPTPDPLTARAADAPVWYVPTGDGAPDRPHRLLTAQHIGFTPDGRIAVIGQGTWHVYGDSGDPHHAPVRTTPAPDALPHDTVRFPTPAPATVADHPAAVKFGRDTVLPRLLSAHLPRDRWTALLSDPGTADLLAEVTDTPPSPDGTWHTMNAEAYRELRRRAGDEGDGPSAKTVEDAFLYYPPESSTDARERLEIVVNLIKELQSEADGGPLPPSLQVLLQRLLRDQGFPPARLPDAARTTTFWSENEPRLLTAELALGMADARDADAPLTGEITAAPAATPSDASLTVLLEATDENQRALLHELLAGAGRPGSPWHTLNADTYLALRSRVAGGSSDAPEPQIRQTVEGVLREYGETVRAATTRVGQLKAVAKAVLKLHATGGVPGSPDNALTAHSRFLVPRMLLDLGITPVPLPKSLYEERAWRNPRNSQMELARVLTFATTVADAVLPAPSGPPASAPVDGGGTGATPSDHRTTGGDAPDAPTVPHTSGAPTSPPAPAPRDTAAPDGDADPEPKDWREELDSLGTRTQEETTAYLQLKKPPITLVGRADRLLRTADRPYTALTKDLPSDAEHWLAVRIPAGDGVDTGGGKILVGKDRLATVTLTGPDAVLGSLRDFERELLPKNSPERPLPLAVLSRVGQALYVNPGADEHHSAVRTAVRAAYAEASRDAERALGEYLTRREDVQEQVRTLVEAAWEKLPHGERHSLGSTKKTGSGSVGTGLGTLEEVVRNGNIREQMHLLVTGAHDPVRKLLGLRKPEPEILTRERSAQGTPEKERIQQDTDIVLDIEERKKKLKEHHTDPSTLQQLLDAEELPRRTELRPEDVVPPLSERERAHVLEDGLLTWEPGERHRQIALRTKSQVTAEATGGLMSAGTSNTTYFVLTVVHAMKEKWKVPVDYQLVRLALLADMLPIGHHTFHEVMTASEAFEKDVLAVQHRPSGSTPYEKVLSYTDDWGRFRSLAPLTEGELREVMPGGRFPDEVALGLEAHERTPAAPPAAPTARRTSRALPAGELQALLDGTPGLTDRTAGLLREALGDGGNTSRDWRRLHVGSFLALHQRVIRSDEDALPPQPDVWDEFGSILERLWGMPPDVPDPEALRLPLDCFDHYYAAVQGDPGDRTRLTALAVLLLELRKDENLPEPGADVSIALGVVAQRLLVDQGYPPALWGEDVGSPGFWPDDVPTLVHKLVAAVHRFTRHEPVRRTPTGIAVGPMNAAQSRMLGSLSPSPGVFVVGMHTGSDTRHDPAVLLKALVDAHDEGRLDGVTEIRFTGCDLATPVQEDTVGTVMSGLWKHRAGGGADADPLTALAGDDPAWYVPGSSLFTTRPVGVTPEGKPAVLGDSTRRHRYTDTGTADHVPARAVTDQDGVHADAVRGETGAEAPLHPVATRFDGTPVPDASGSSAERIAELTAYLARSHQDNGTHHLVDPDAGPGEAERVRSVVARFPGDDRFFTLASHITGSDGAPVWRGRRVGPDELAGALSRLAEDGAWDTSKPLRFAACGLGADAERSYAADTLRELRKLRPDLPLTAYAPRSTLWFVPSVTDADPAGTGHTVVARQVTWGPDGKPRLTPDHWVKLSLPADGDGTVEATLLDAHMPPDGLLSSDDVPVTTRTPEGYLLDDGVTSGDSIRAVPFGPAAGTDDGRPESSAAAGRLADAAASESGGAVGDGAVVASSPEASPPPRAPWYTDRKALGDGWVTEVTGPVPDHRKTTELLAPLAEQAGGKGTADRIVRRLVPLLDRRTPADWDEFLRKGAVFSVDEKVVIVTAGPAGLSHHAVQPKDELRPYASRNQAATGHALSSGGNLGTSGGVDAVAKLVGLGDPTGVIPSVKFQVGGTYGSSRTATTETQAAGRTVIKEMNEFDGGVSLQVHVVDRKGGGGAADVVLPVGLRFAFPADVTPEAPETDWQVVRPEALKTVLSTVNAIAPGPLLVDLAATLRKAGFASDSVARFVSDVADGFFNEKSLKDGNQWWSTGSLTSRAFSGEGLWKPLGGHFVVGAVLTGLRPKGSTGSALRVREDSSDTFGVKSSGKHADRTGVSLGVSVPLDTSKLTFVASAELGISASRSHNFDVGGSDKSKVKIKHKEEIQAEYHATARFHVEFFSTSKRPPLSFTSTVELAVGVPASRSADFENLLLGPEAERSPAEPQPARDTTPVTPYPSRFQVAGTAVRAVLRLARKGPSTLPAPASAPPFPKQPVTGPAGLLKASWLHPIEIAAPGGRLPAGGAWAGLDGNPRVKVVDQDRSHTLASPGTTGPAFRHQVDVTGRITGVQRLRSSTFTELFGPLLAEGHADRLAELHAQYPWLAFEVRSAPGNPPNLVPPVPDGITRLHVRPGADGALTVLGTVHHPVEQAVLTEPPSSRNRRPTEYAVGVTRDGGPIGPVRREDFAKDPQEPVALASRTGLGPGVAAELPGSEQVLRIARNWLDGHLEPKRLDEDRYAQFHRELEAAFGTPAMRAHFADLLGPGVPVVLRAGDREMRLHLRSELLALRSKSTEDGLSTTRAVTRNTNQAVGVGDQVAVSLSLGVTPRFETGKDRRVEVPIGKIGGGFTLSNTKESVATTVKTTREQETSGGHTVFSYEVAHHLTATVHGSGGKLLSGTSQTVEGPDVSALVRVGDDHLAVPGPPVSPTVGTVQDLAGDDAPWRAGAGTPFLPSLQQGTGNIHPDFLGTRDLTLVAARMVAGNGGGQPPKDLDDAFGRRSGDAVGALRQGLTPEIEDAFTPAFLQSQFEQLIGADGAVFPLPPAPSGRAQALVIRLRATQPLHEGTGVGTNLAYGAETGTKTSTSRTGSKNFGAGIGIGGFAGFTDKGVSVAGNTSLDYSHTRTTVRTDASASTLSSTLTHKGATHRYRADALYEITHHTWDPAGRLSTGPSNHTATKRYVRVDGGLELTVPDPEARALGLEVPGDPLPGTEPGTRAYLDADLAKAVAHVEKLDAKDVLPTVRKLLGRLKGMPEGTDGSIPTDLSRGLGSVFSAESLRANFTALSTTSVRQLVKLRQPGGGTRLIGIRVGAEVGPPVHVGSREDVTLTTGDTATESAASATGSSNRLGVQASLTVKGLDAEDKPRGGVKAGGGLEGSAGSTRTETSSERDQHTVEFAGTAQQFTHPVVYRVEVFDASEPHQLTRMAGAALKAPAQFVDWATDGRAGRWFTERWGEQWETFFPSGRTPKQTDTIPGGAAWLLVPDHLTGEAPAPPAQTVPATPPAPAEPKATVRPRGPSAVLPDVGRLGADLAPAVQALSLPKLDAVVKWLPTAAALPHRVAGEDTEALTREDLAPTTLAGLRTDLLTTERNLRANIRQLLGDGYGVPVAGGKEVTVRLLVRGTAHLASETFETMVDTGARERETERERDRTTLGWSASVAPDVRVHLADTGEQGGPGVSEIATNLNLPSLNIGGESGRSSSTNRSETVDEREKKSGVHHYYKADVTWVLTGSRGTTVEVEVNGGLIGLLPDATVDELEKKHGRFGRKPAPATTTEENPTPQNGNGNGNGNSNNGNAGASEIEEAPVPVPLPGGSYVMPLQDWSS